MDNLFSHGHRQLLRTKGSGLSDAWRRAAEEASRQGNTQEAPRVGLAPASSKRQFAGVLVASVLAAALVGTLTAGPTGGDEVALPPAPPLLLAATE